VEYKVEYDADSGVCEIRVSGLHARPRDSQELMRVAGTYAIEQGCTRFLFDLREATIVGGTMAAYETILDTEKYGVQKVFRVAAVYSRISEDEKFIEDLGAYRGAVAFQVFNDIYAAREWVARE
jgi:hypothetical protein